ncbi:MAG: branched-chain amino acid ABC transporter substrate-binding protein [Anaerolineae bacterium]|nr:branched-chain amino acid ABC transporter substrate-binding protein [Anaerolineae bacterium]
MGSRIGILLLLLATAVGCGGRNPETVRVVIAYPLGLDIGYDMLHGAELALDEAGGMAGDVAVELVVFDTSDPEGSPVSPEMEIQAAEAAVAEPLVVAYLGAPTSDQARASLPILNAALIPQFSPAATWPGLTKPGFGPGEPGVYYPTGRRTFFRMAPSDEVQGVVAANWVSFLRAGTVTVVDDRTAYGSGIAGIFELQASDQGIEIVGRYSFEGREPDMTQIATLAQTIVAAEPDLVFLGTSLGTGGAQIVLALRELDPNIVLMGPDGMLQDQLISAVGVGLAEGIYAINVSVPASQMPSARGLVSNFEALYGKEPPAYAVNSYEAMNVILYAIERAETLTPEGVLDVIAGLDTFTGALGTWSFSPAGDISRAVFSGMQVRDGAWAFVRVID